MTREELDAKDSWRKSMLEVTKRLELLAEAPEQLDIAPHLLGRS